MNVKKNDDMIFLCGCSLNRLLDFGYKERFDNSGNPICPDHQLREKGWRTSDGIKKGILRETAPIS